MSLASLWKVVPRVHYPLCGKTPFCLSVSLTPRVSLMAKVYVLVGAVRTVNPHLPSPGHLWFCRVLAEATLDYLWSSVSRWKSHSIFDFTYVGTIPYLIFSIPFFVFFSSAENRTAHSIHCAGKPWTMVQWCSPFFSLSFILFNGWCFFIEVSV